MKRPACTTWVKDAPLELACHRPLSWGARRSHTKSVIRAGRPHLISEIDLLLAVHLLFDLALLGQLLQRLHYGLEAGEGRRGRRWHLGAAAGPRPDPRGGGSEKGSSPSCPVHVPVAGSRTRPGRCKAGSAPAGTSGGWRGLRGAPTPGGASAGLQLLLRGLPGLPRDPISPLPPAAASARPLLMASRRHNRKPDVLVARGDAPSGGEVARESLER